MGGHTEGIEREKTLSEKYTVIFLQKSRKITVYFSDKVFSLSMPSVCPHLTTVKATKKQRLGCDFFFAPPDCSVHLHFMSVYQIVFTRVTSVWIFQSNISEVIGLPQYLHRNETTRVLRPHFAQ